MRALFQQGDWVMHGGARGVDTWANEIAWEKGARVHLYQPDWQTYGKAAGPLRNDDMLTAWLNIETPKGVLVAWDGESKGTADMIGKLDRHGIAYILLWMVPHASIV